MCIYTYPTSAIISTGQKERSVPRKNCCLLALETLMVAASLPEKLCRSSVPCFFFLLPLLLPVRSWNRLEQMIKSASHGLISSYRMWTGKTQKPGQSRWVASMEKKRIRLRRHQFQKVGTATGVRCARGHVKPKRRWMRRHACINLNRKWSCPKVLSHQRLIPLAFEVEYKHGWEVFPSGHEAANW